MQILSSINAVISALIQLVILAGCGFILVKKDVLDADSLRALSRILINIIFPFFIFNELLNNFTFAQFTHWWIYPLLSFALIGAAFLLAHFFLVFRPELNEKKEYLAAVTFSNAGYLPLVLISGLFDKAIVSQMLVYLFLFLLGFNLLIFSFGINLFVGRSQEVSKFKKLFSPPVIAILLGIVSVFFKINTVLPSPIVKAIGLIGACTLPLSMMVVGASLALIEIKNIFKNKDLQSIVFIKLIFIPILAIFVLSFFNINPLVKFLLLLEASMPTAVTLSLFCHKFKLKGELTTQAIFWTHISSIITLPFFLVVFKIVTGLI